MKYKLGDKTEWGTYLDPLEIKIRNEEKDCDALAEATFIEYARQEAADAFFSQP